MLNIGPGRKDLLIALAGRMVSTFGDGLALVALILRLEADGARPYEVGLLLAAGIIPLLLLSRPVGRLVDTHDSRHLLVGAGLMEVACTVPLIVVHSVVVIVPLVALLGAAASVSATTWSALVPRIVGEDHVAEAVSAQQSLNALVLVGAPAVGGLLAGAFGSGLPLALDAASFVVVTAAAALVGTRRLPTGLGTDRGSARAKGGFEILRTDRLLAPLAVGLGVVVLLVGMVDVVLVFLIRATLHAGGVWYGVAEAAWMAGMVAGSVGGGRLRTERSPDLGDDRRCGSRLRRPGSVRPGSGRLDARTVVGPRGDREWVRGGVLLDPAREPHARLRPGTGVGRRQCRGRRRSGRFAAGRRGGRRRAQSSGRLCHGRALRRGRRNYDRRVQRPGGQNRPTGAPGLHGRHWCSRTLGRGPGPRTWRASSQPGRDGSERSLGNRLSPVSVPTHDYARGRPRSGTRDRG